MYTEHIYEDNGALFQETYRFVFVGPSIALNTRSEMSSSMTETIPLEEQPGYANTIETNIASVYLANAGDASNTRRRTRPRCASIILQTIVDADS